MAIYTNKKTLWIIFLTILIDMLGIGVLVPIFPILVTPSSAFKITPDGWSTAEGFIMLGWILACFPLAQFFCAPILGQLSDRYGRKRVLAISISGTAISYILFAIGIMTKNIPLMFISRTLDGASGGNISVAQAVIGDISNSQNRAKNFGLVGLAFGLGFILGPFLGGKLSDPHLVSWFNPVTPFWFASILSIINLISLLNQLPETLVAPIHKRIDLYRPINNIIKVVAIPELRRMISVTFLFTAGFTFYTAFWGVVLVEQFGFTQGKIGNFFASMGVIIVFAQVLVVRPLSGRVADYKVLKWSIISSGLCIIAYYFIPANHPNLIYLLLPFMAIGNALTMSFGSSLLIQLSPSRMRGEVMGINSSVGALAQSIPAIFAGYIAAYYAKLPVLLGGVIIVTSGLLFRYLFKSDNDFAMFNQRED